MAEPQLVFRLVKTDVCLKRGAVNHFLVDEGERPDCVEKRLLRACAEATLVAITVPQWVTRNIYRN